MKSKFSTSDSIIGSLCREIQCIDTRSKIITNSIVNTNNKKLITRLKRELSELKKRLQVIQDLSRVIVSQGNVDKLSIEFLEELIGRNLIHSILR